MATEPAPHRSSGRVARAGLLAALTTAGVLGSALPASAHGTLAEATPADGTKVSEPLEVVDLYFTEAINPGVAKFEVYAPNGERVDAGWWPGQTRRLREPVQEFNLVDGKWTPVFYDYGYGTQVALKQLPQKGTYRVSYYNVASDGDEVKGELTFTYSGAPTQPRVVQTPSPLPQQVAPPVASAGASAPAAAVPQPATTPVAQAPAAAPASEDSGGLPVPALVAAVVVVLGLVVGARVLVSRRSSPTAATGTGRARGKAPAAGGSRPAAARPAPPRSRAGGQQPTRKGRP
nr:copper resistance protein CopC [Motilibacter aurantiacus]